MRSAALLLAALAASLGAHAQGPRTDTIQFLGNAAGAGAVTHAESAFNDPGRGDHSMGPGITARTAHEGS